MQKWAKARMAYGMHSIKIKRTAKSMEKGYFQHFTGKEYWPSPFGSFENFSKIISEHGWEKYKPYLTGKKNYYLRFKTKIPVNDLEFF